jgi:hypothetical protein
MRCVAKRNEASLTDDRAYGFHVVIALAGLEGRERYRILLHPSRDLFGWREVAWIPWFDPDIRHDVAIELDAS